MNNTAYKIAFADHTCEFTVAGSSITYNNDLCIWVYGYTCGVGNINFYRDDGGWVLEDSVLRNISAFAIYEFPIESGNNYKLNFYGINDLVHTYEFTCTGSHVHHDYDRCLYPEGGLRYPVPPPIVVWEGYDYNVVLFYDNHGNRVENAQVAIYDRANSTYIQRWTPSPDNYALLGARFNDSDHNVQIMMRTFDGIFTLDTTHPANGSSLVGEEEITYTNWTIPIHYNVKVHPRDQFGVPLTDVFCGLSEYTPYDPLSFWGYSMGGRQFIPVTNCSGFAMCDIYAEKGGYEDYNATALNWTTKSAMVKDYRHIATLTKE